MNSRTLPIIIGIIIIALVGGLVLFQTRDTDDALRGTTATSTETAATTNSEATDTTGSSGTDVRIALYTMATVGEHSTAASCWSVIDGNVYDLTDWIGKHPGGERAITGLCGKDGSAAFHGQHGNNPKQANILVDYKIGTLGQ